MRYGRDGKIYEDNGKFQGINLGADFVAEHEWGINDMLKKFKCNDKLKGLNGKKIEYGRVNNVLDKGWYIITSSDHAIDKENGISETLLSWPTQKLVFNGKEVEVKSGWDSDNFAILTTSFDLYDQLYQAFVNKDIALSVGGRAFFANGGLNILIYSQIPKDVIKETEDKQKKYEENKSKLENSKEYKALISAQKEWKNKYSFSRSTPWDFMYLGDFDGRAGKGKFWLNPENQSHINSGWFTLSDLTDWVNGKGNIPKEGLFEDLKTELSIPLSTWAFNPIHDSDYRKNFRGISFNLWRDRNDPLYPLGKKLSKYDRFYTMDQKMVDLIESRIKRMLVDDMFCQMHVYSFEDCPPEYRTKRYEKFLPTMKDNFQIRQQTKAEVDGMFWMLKLLGYGDFGACNITEGDGIKNLSFWKNRLEYEAEYDFLNLCGKLPEAWKIDFNKEK